MPLSQADNYYHGLPGPTFNCINKELREFHIVAQIIQLRKLLLYCTPGLCLDSDLYRSVKVT